MAPLKRAGRSVQRMANRLNRLEGALSTKADAESQRLAKKFGLVGGEKGGLRSRLLKATLAAATQYEVSVGGPRAEQLACPVETVHPADARPAHRTTQDNTYGDLDLAREEMLWLRPPLQEGEASGSAP